MTSDYRNYENNEQFCFILSGEGEVLIGDRKYHVREGSVTCLPRKPYNQAFTDKDNGWLEYLVLS